MRSKEEAYDYRYFPEPDLVPLAPPGDWLARVGAALPALPAPRRADLMAAVGSSPSYAAAVATVVQKNLDGLVQAAIGAGADPGLAVNRAANELTGGTTVEPAAFARVLRMEGDGRLTATQAKAVLAEMAASGGDPEAIATAKGFEALDGDVVADALDAAIAAAPGEWARYAGGEVKLAGFFVGKVMAATKGKADGKAVTALLRARAASSVASGP
jgi:aspartyl-tRNA(Asn)/glutamyl-tRNA(Gln) amidotransferase subunit B